MKYMIHKKKNLENSYKEELIMSPEKKKDAEVCVGSNGDNVFLKLDYM